VCDRDVNRASSSREENPTTASANTAPTNTPSASRPTRDERNNSESLGLAFLESSPVLPGARRGKSGVASSGARARHLRTRRRVDGAHTGGSAAKEGTRRPGHDSVSGSVGPEEATISRREVRE
jgi:hypothetical protein